MENFNQYSDNFDTNTAGMQDVKSSGNFFGKVMASFGFAVMISAAGTYTGFEFLGPFFIQNPGLVWIFYVLELILVFTSRTWSTKYPLNYVLFAAFAFLSGLTIVPLLVGIINEFGSALIIMKALLAAALLFSATAIFGLVTKRNLQGLGGILWMSLIGMIIVSVVGIFFPWGNQFEMLFSGFGVILFGIYTMYDFQRIKTFPSDRYIDAALEIYLDMFNLFIFILRLIAGSSRD